jgi:release factor glutamine methyltransferase
VQTALRADEQFPVIIADPPYLPSSATGRWPQDPVLAIDGGADGLNLIRACLKVAAEHLSRGGCMLLQVAGSGQAAQVDRILQARPGWGLQAGELRTVDAERAVLRVDGA